MNNNSTTNVLNIKEIVSFCNDYADSFSRQEIKNWINSQLFNTIKSNKEFLITIDKSNFMFFIKKNSYEEQIYMTNSLKGNESHLFYPLFLENYEKFKNILVYFRVLESTNGKIKIQRSSFEDLHKKALKYLNTSNVEGVDCNTILKYPDGFSVVQLQSKKSFIRESELMANCISTESEKNYEYLDYYSLIDRNGKPKVNISTFKRTPKKGYKRIDQIKGKANIQLPYKYIPYVIEFLNKEEIRWTTSYRYGVFNLGKKYYTYTDILEKSILISLNELFNISVYKYNFMGYDLYVLYNQKTKSTVLFAEKCINGDFYKIECINLIEGSYFDDCSFKNYFNYLYESKKFDKDSLKLLKQRKLIS